MFIGIRVYVTGDSEINPCDVVTYVGCGQTRDEVKSQIERYVVDEEDVEFIWNGKGEFYYPVDGDDFGEDRVVYQIIDTSN